MTRQRYPETFKIEAVKQVTERGRPVADVARAIGVSSHSLYAWCSGQLNPDTWLGRSSAFAGAIPSLC